MNESWHGKLSGYQYHKCRCDECKAVKYLYNRDWQRKNKDLVAKWNKQWRQVNRPPKPKEIPHGTVSGYSYHKCRCVKCKEAKRIHNREFQQNNPDYVAKMRNQRRTKNVIDYNYRQINARFEYFGNRCWMCGIDVNKLVIDHVKPISKGGWDTPANIRPACVSCNSRKSNKWPINF